MTKLRLLDLGTVAADQGFFIEGAGAATESMSAPQPVRRRLKVIGTLIEHPKSGVILYEVGTAPNFRELWPQPVQDVFAFASYTVENRLDKQLNAAGYELKDVRAIILGHLHIDHAGGLEFFRGTNVPIYVHQEELKYAWYAVATKEDFGAYLPHYMDCNFNWKAIHGDETEIFDGLTLYHTPGHTPGLMALKVNLKNADPFVLTSDTFFLKENYYEEKPQGWLVRDMPAWWASLRRIQALVARNRANVVLGHDPDVLAEFSKEKFYD